MHRLDEACRAFRTALELQPDFTLAEFNLGTTLLLAGDYAAGWQGYRHARGLAARRRFCPIFPIGTAVPVRGGRLLIDAEQGFGERSNLPGF